MAGLSGGKRKGAHGPYTSIDKSGTKDKASYTIRFFNGSTFVMDAYTVTGLVEKAYQHFLTENPNLVKKTFEKSIFTIQRGVR